MGNIFRRIGYSETQKEQHDQESQMTHEVRGIVSLKYEA